MLLSLIKVEGHSMEPFLNEGSFFIATSIFYKFKKPKIEDVILFKFQNKIIVKKIFNIKNNKYYIEGINKKDTKNFDPLDKSDILGKLLFKI